MLSSHFVKPRDLGRLQKKRVWYRNPTNMVLHLVSDVKSENIASGCRWYIKSKSITHREVCQSGSALGVGIYSLVCPRVYTPQNDATIAARFLIHMPLSIPANHLGRDLQCHAYSMQKPMVESCTVMFSIFFRPFHVLLCLIIRAKTGRYIDVTAVPSRHFFHVLLGYRRASAQWR